MWGFAGLVRAGNEMAAWVDLRHSARMRIRVSGHSSSCQARVLFSPVIATSLIQQIPPGRPTLYLLKKSFAPDPPAPFLYFRTISRQFSPCYSVSG